MLQLGLAGMVDPEKAAALYRRACAASFMPGCEKEGLLVWNRDRARATLLLQQACVGGHAPSCRLLDQARAGKTLPADEELLFAKVTYHY
jgi:hypothetical protein